MASCSPQALAHFLLSQVFRPHAGGIFRLPALSRWSAHGVPPPFVPRRLGHGEVSLAPPRALRQSASALWRPHTYTWFHHLCHVISHGHCAQSSRCTLGQRAELCFTCACRHHILSCCRRCKEVPTKHHVRSRSRPSVFAHPAHSLSEKTSTIGCSACLLYTTKHLGLPGLHVLGIRLLHPSHKFLH